MHFRGGALEEEGRPVRKLLQVRLWGDEGMAAEAGAQLTLLADGCNGSGHRQPGGGGAGFFLF